jgi:hypothetical protein
MTCCRSKNDFCKKSGARFNRAKGQSHPSSSEIGRSLRKNPENKSEGLRDEMRSDMCILGGLLFMWGVVSSFTFAVLMSTSQKNPISALKNRKCTFRGTKRKLASVVFLAIPRATCVFDMAVFR